MDRTRTEKGMKGLPRRRWFNQILEVINRGKNWQEIQKERFSEERRNWG
jgi:hypothetical protein